MEKFAAETEAFARALAPLLSDETTWHVQVIPGLRHVRIQYGASADYAITVARDWGNEKRWTIRGDVPRTDAKGEYHDTLDYKETAAEITVSITRTVESVAKDVKRRLLPAYDVQHAKARERLRKVNEYQTVVDAVAAKLAPYGERVRHQRHDTPEIYTEAGTVQVYASEVRVRDFRCTPDQMLEILRYLRGERARLVA